jgi:hypothetical protein
LAELLCFDFPFSCIKEASQISLFKSHYDFHQESDDPIEPNHKEFIKILETYLANYRVFQQSKILIEAVDIPSLKTDIGMDRLCQMICVIIQPKVETKSSVMIQSEVINVEIKSIIRATLCNAIDKAQNESKEEKNIFVFHIWTLLIDLMSKDLVANFINN